MAKKSKNVFIQPNVGFTQELVSFRKRKRMSQGKLARMAHISTATIGYWESGRVLPSEEMLKLLHGYFYHKHTPNFYEFCLLCGRIPECMKDVAFHLLIEEVREVNGKSQNSLCAA